MKLTSKNLVPTILNGLGLAIAMAAMYLFMTQVEFDTRFNRSIPNYDRIYRLEFKTPLHRDQWNTHTCRRQETMVCDVPHVQKVQSLLYQGSTNITVDNNTLDVIRTDFGNPGPSFFGLRMLAGTCENMVWGDYVFTRTEAERVFGTIDCVGRKFYLSDDQSQAMTVVGVCEDMPDNCMLANGMFGSYGDNNLDDAEQWAYDVYVMLDPTADARDTELAIYEALLGGWNDTEHREEDKMVFNMRMMPLTDTHFSGASDQDTGNRNVLYVLLGGSIFIILMALFNLTNFTLSQAPMRIKDINVRKVLGASNSSLRWTFVKDNLLLALASLLLAALLVYAFSSNGWCMELMQGKVDFAHHPSLSLFTCVAALAVAVLSALYPAWYATSFHPAMVLKGSFALSPQGRRLRSVMLMMQFAIAIILVVFVLVMQSQAHYIFNADYGFNKDQVVIAQTTPALRERTDAVRTELEKLTCVESVGFAMCVLGDNSAQMRWGRMHDDHQMSFYSIFVDHKFLSTLELPIVKGRDFKETDYSQGAYVINEDMAQTYNFLKTDETLYGPRTGQEEGNYTVVGVCRNFKLRSMHKGNDNMPVAFCLMGPDMQGWGNCMFNLFARIPARQDKIEARQQIGRVLKDFDADADFDLRFLDERLENTYQDEFRLISQMRVFALICILIILFGVLSLTIFETEYRRKEIGIRKVMGSTQGEILNLFTRRYLLPLIVSFVLGAPIAYVISTIWLQGYAERTAIHWWLFPLALCLVSAVVLLTVVVQSLRVARINPVETIKTE